MVGYHSPDDVRESNRTLDSIQKGLVDRVDMMLRITGITGQVFHIKCDGTVIENPTTHHRHYVGVLRDVTNEQLYLSHLTYSANHDALTGALSRNFGLNRLYEDMGHKSPLCIAYIDLDNFKMVNDLYGHEMGDMILRDFSKKILDAKSDHTYMIRLGGDEFLLCFKGLPCDQVRDEMISLSQLPIKCREESITFSYGMVEFDHHENPSIEAFIHEADQRMYAMKRTKYQQANK